MYILPLPYKQTPSFVVIIFQAQSDHLYTAISGD